MRGRTVRGILPPIALALVLALVAIPSSAQLTTVETDGIRLVYFEGSESFLVPHAGRTFLNSLASQKKLFGYEPDSEISVLLIDSAGLRQRRRHVGATQRAHASTSRRSSYAFETIPPTSA